MTAIQDLSLAQYLEVLASAAPTPGGGAAAAITAAQGVALLAMAARLSRDEHENAAATSKGHLDLTAALQELDTARSSLLKLADDDGIAFQQVLTTYKLPTTTADEKNARQLAIQSALKAAATVPLAVMQICSDLLERAANLLKRTKPLLVSDVGIGVQLISAAIIASRFNVEVNLKYIKDVGFVEQTHQSMQALLTEGHSRSQDLLDAARQKMLTSR